jgi:hypothetical protein
MSKRVRQLVVVGWVLIVAAGLIAGCKGRGNDENADATAQAEGRLPTLEAQLTQFSIQLTQNPDIFNTPATVVIATPEGNLGTPVDPDAFLTSVAQTNAPFYGSGGSGGAVTGGGSGDGNLDYVGTGGTPGFDGGDSHDTTAVNVLTPGQSIQGELSMPFDAHNWLYEGKAGEYVTIKVIGPDADPRVSLIGPDGTLLFENDDIIQNVDVNASIVAILPTDGVYTVRVTSWNTGSYTLTLTVE